MIGSTRDEVLRDALEMNPPSSKASPKRLSLP